jgi:hypothetical protein
MWMGGEARRMSNSLCKRSLRGFVIGSLRSDCWPQFARLAFAVCATRLHFSGIIFQNGTVIATAIIAAWTQPCLPPPTPLQALSDVGVEMQLVRMRAQPDGIDFPLSLVVEPGLDHVSGKYIAAEKKRMITFEGIQRLVQ